MIPALRQAFNASWSSEKYRAFLDALDLRCGAHVTFRVCETPCFFPQALIDQVARAGAEMLEQLLGDAAYRRASDVTIPAQFNVPNEGPRPLFAAVDFGLVRDANGGLQPRLVEIQGFPSLYCFQVEMGQQFAESYRVASHLRILPDGSSMEDYWRTLRAAILGTHAAENVVLLEIDPFEQKTLPDFLATERVCGIRPVNIREVIKDGKQLLYSHDGKRIRIHRIYNRAIVDELVRKNVALPFRFTDELDVEWAGHPNWFFRLSKFSIPYLKHAFVPETWFLDQLPRVPDDLEQYVLKPLYSFAGLGVMVGPERADLDRIPAGERHNYILQRRMRFEPVIETPHGPTQAEIRVLYIDQDGASHLKSPTLPAQTAGRVGHPQNAVNLNVAARWKLGPLIIRMGRGKMMGVDHNRDLEWVGASAGLIG